MIKTFSKVLQKLNENVLTLSPKKCHLAIKSVEVLGYVFTQDGLKPSPGKVKALEEAEPPESKEALRSFLGMVGWNQRFIERFSEMSTVLHDLLNEKGSFKWKDEHQQAFDAIKKSLTKETMLRYFEKGRKAAVFVDARKKAHKIGDRGGMSAILAQKYQDGLHPIYFASRRLTDLSQDGGKQSLQPGQLNGEQRRNLVNFLLELQHSRYLQMQRVWFPCLTSST